METSVIETMIKWTNIHNIEKQESMIARFRDEIAEKSNFSLIGQDSYSIIFTSSQAESNSTIITMSVRSFIKQTSKKPHIIVSRLEDESTISLAKDLSEEDVDVTYLDKIDLKIIANAIRPNTCILSIIWYIPYLGIINDIESIGELSKKNKVPFHSDTSHIFGKTPINPITHNLAAFTSSFYQLNGLTGIALLVIRNSFIKGWNIKAMIPGNENYFLRGGLNCIHNIAAAYQTHKLTFKDRNKKNQIIHILKEYLIKTLKRYMNTYYLSEYLSTQKSGNGIIFLFDEELVKNKLIHNVPLTISNIDINKIINTLNQKQLCICKENNEVMKIYNIPSYLRKTAINISINEYTKKENIDYLITNLIRL